MNKPVVSVIMGTYNPSPSEIRRAVDSIIDQSFEDWEMIIYDDGSDDEHKKVLSELVEKDPRIRMIHGKKNLGLAYGLNRCIEASYGIYIARMDDDDVSEPDRILEQKLFLDANREYDWVGCLALLFDKKGVWGKTVRPEKPQKNDFLGSSPFIHPSVMFRRDALELTGGYTDDPLTSRCEDYDLFMNLYSLGRKGYNIQKPLLRYCENRYFLSRSWKYSCNEVFIRYRGFNKLGILNIKTGIYVFKPIFVKIAAYLPVFSQVIRTSGNRGDVRD